MPIIKNDARSGKQERRSPLKSKPLRTPGQSLRDELLGVVLEDWISPMLTVLFFGLMAAIEWIRWACKVLPTFRTSLLMTGITIAAAVITYRRHQIVKVNIKNLRQGLDGELAVGQFLDERCREQGYKVIHDLKGDGFNVDHVVIGPGGIFAIETKTISKPTIGSPVVTYNGESVLIDGMTPDRDPIVQAKACASFIARTLAESTGRDEKQIFVRPVVLYPGWYIDGSSSGKDVWVLEPKGFPQFLLYERQQLSSEDVALFHSRLKLANRSAQS